MPSGPFNANKEIIIKTFMRVGQLENVQNHPTKWLEKVQNKAIIRLENAQYFVQRIV